MPEEIIKTEGSASFLRAARAGNLEKVLEYLKQGVDINTCNANGLNALHLASKEGFVDVVRELLKRGANVDAATKKGNTALHIASLAGQEEVVRILVENNCNVNVQSQNGFTPLYMAAQENHDTVVTYLLAHGANQSLATEDGFTPLAVALQQGHDKVVALLLENDTRGKVRLPALHIAAKKDDTKAAALLLQNEHNPDVTSKSGFTPLHIAAHYGNENIAKLLLEKGANVNYSARHNITPLHVASKWGRANMITLLLAHGAIIDCRTRDMLTPLHCAARSGHDQVVDLLVEKGAPISAKTKNGLAPLHMAAQGDHVDTARILLYHRAGVDDVTVDYLTPLHVAAHCGHVRVAKLLLDRGADPNSRALNGFTPLHIACKKNRIKVVELLLKYHAAVEATTESGLTPLHVAAFMGCMNIVVFLIQHNANPDVTTVRGETPLHLAARANQTDVIRILLRNGATVDARARELQTPLHIASRLGNTDIVSLLLQHGAQVDAATRDQYTPLHIAAKEGQEEVAILLLDRQAPMGVQTKKGFTPLHLAAKYGNLNVAKLLIERGADVDVEGKNQVTPLHVAAHYNHEKVALLLLEKGAAPQAAAKNGYTPLHIAGKKNQMDIATTLLEYKADPNAESKAGFTPLHLASQEGHVDMASMLLEHGAQPNSRAKNGLTPMHLCAQEDRVPVAEVLVKHKAEIDPQTKAGYTPLHVACHFGQVNMVRFLLRYGAPVDAVTRMGYTPLHQAAQQGHGQIVKILLEAGASPNAVTSSGQTPMAIAQRMGYVSVVETLRTVTETTVITETTTVTEEKYKVQSPEMMQETFMSESEDEGGEEVGGDSFGDEIHKAGEHAIGEQDHEHLLPMDKSMEAEQMQLEKLIERQQLVGASAAPLAEVGSPGGAAGGGGSYQFDGSYAPDNVDISRGAMHAGFLISFMVDARGGAMRGCRHSGVRIIIPPRKAPMPMRITCRYLRKEKLVHPPPLCEGEALASRVLEMGPAGAKFLGPVILEVPHFASLRGREREIVILRSDDGEKWKEHQLEATEDAVQEVLNESFDPEELSQLEDLNTTRITRILSNDFPQYFAIVTRVRQEVHAVGPDGGMISSTVVPQVQSIFPDGSLTKTIKVSLQAQPIPHEVVTKLHGNRVAVSPIVTVEPRRRKFHKPITLCIPLPQSAHKGMITTQYQQHPPSAGGTQLPSQADSLKEPPTLRLLCSITGGTAPAQWEDITGTTQLTFTPENVSFTTTVSARFWLMDCQTPRDSARMAQEIYNEAIIVPYMAKFVVFARRVHPTEGQLRVFCMTDDKEDKTLERQEHYEEIAKSRDVEVLSSRQQYLEFAGNLVPITKSGDQLNLKFLPFQENRLMFNMRVRDSDDPEAAASGRLAFMKEPKIRADNLPPQHPICTLAITLPDYVGDVSTTTSERDLAALDRKYRHLKGPLVDTVYRTDVSLTELARDIGPDDWERLGRALNIPQDDLNQVKREYPGQETLIVLRIWMEREGPRATGSNLERALRAIGREDVIKKRLQPSPPISRPAEKVATVTEQQRPAPAPRGSIERGASLDVSFDGKELKQTSPILEEPYSPNLLKLQDSGLSDVQHYKESPAISPVVETVTSHKTVHVSSPESPEQREETITVTKIKRRIDTDFGEPIEPSYKDTAEQLPLTAQALTKLTEGLVDYEAAKPAPSYAERASPEKRPAVQEQFESRYVERGDFVPTGFDQPQQRPEMVEEAIPLVRTPELKEIPTQDEAPTKLLAKRQESRESAGAPSFYEPHLVRSKEVEDLSSEPEEFYEYDQEGANKPSENDELQQQVLPKSLTAPASILDEPPAAGTVVSFTSGLSTSVSAAAALGTPAIRRSPSIPPSEPAASTELPKPESPVAFEIDVEENKIPAVYSLPHADTDNNLREMSPDDFVVVDTYPHDVEAELEVEPEPAEAGSPQLEKKKPKKGGPFWSSWFGRAKKQQASKLPVSKASKKEKQKQKEALEAAAAEPVHFVDEEVTVAPRYESPQATPETIQRRLYGMAADAELVPEEPVIPVEEEPLAAAAEVGTEKRAPPPRPPPPVRQVHWAEDEEPIASVLTPDDELVSASDIPVEWACTEIPYVPVAAAAAIGHKQQQQLDYYSLPEAWKPPQDYQVMALKPESELRPILHEPALDVAATGELGEVLGQPLEIYALREENELEELEGPFEPVIYEPPAQAVEMQKEDHYALPASWLPPKDQESTTLVREKSELKEMFDGEFLSVLGGAMGKTATLVLEPAFSSVPKDLDRLNDFNPEDSRLVEVDRLQYEASPGLYEEHVIDPFVAMWAVCAKGKEVTDAEERGIPAQVLKIEKELTEIEAGGALAELGVAATTAPQLGAGVETTPLEVGALRLEPELAVLQEAVAEPQLVPTAAQEKAPSADETAFSGPWEEVVPLQAEKELLPLDEYLPITEEAAGIRKADFTLASLSAASLQPEEVKPDAAAAPLRLEPELAEVEAQPVEDDVSYESQKKRTDPFVAMWAVCSKENEAIIVEEQQQQQQQQQQETSLAPEAVADIPVQEIHKQQELSEIQLEPSPLEDASSYEAQQKRIDPFVAMWAVCSKGNEAGQEPSAAATQSFADKMAADIIAKVGPEATEEFVKSDIVPVSELPVTESLTPHSLTLDADNDLYPLDDVPSTPRSSADESPKAKKPEKEKEKWSLFKPSKKRDYYVLPAEWMPEVGHEVTPLQLEPELCSVEGAPDIEDAKASSSPSTEAAGGGAAVFPSTIHTLKADPELTEYDDLILTDVAQESPTVAPVEPAHYPASFTSAESTAQPSPPPPQSSEQTVEVEINFQRVEQNMGFEECVEVTEHTAPANGPRDGADSYYTLPNEWLPDEHSSVHVLLPFESLPGIGDADSPLPSEAAAADSMQSSVDEVTAIQILHANKELPPSADIGQPSPPDARPVEQPETPTVEITGPVAEEEVNIIVEFIRRPEEAGIEEQADEMIGEQRGDESAHEDKIPPDRAQQGGLLVDTVAHQQQAPSSGYSPREIPQVQIDEADAEDQPEHSPEPETFGQFEPDEHEDEIIETAMQRTTKPISEHHILTEYSPPIAKTADITHPVQECSMIVPPEQEAEEAPEAQAEPKREEQEHVVETVLDVEIVKRDEVFRSIVMLPDSIHGYMDPAEEGESQTTSQNKLLLTESSSSILSSSDVPQSVDQSVSELSQQVVQDAITEAISSLQNGGEHEYAEDDYGYGKLAADSKDSGEPKIETSETVQTTESVTDQPPVAQG